MTGWRPSPDEERWLDVAAQVAGDVPREALLERTGGWRTTGPLARIALFAMGVVAALLLYGTFGFGGRLGLFLAGSITLVAAERLSATKRLHASGIEEGLCVAGAMILAVWVILMVGPDSSFVQGPFVWLLPIVTAAAAGLRLLNPFVVTCAVLGLVSWVGLTSVAEAVDETIGNGMTAFGFGCALALLALALGARQYRRPSHDRMLDWCVASLPVVAYLQLDAAAAFDAISGGEGPGTGRVVTILVLLILAGALLVAALRRRRHAPLIGFIGCLACIAVEVRLASSLPTEFWLIVYGTAALLAGFGLDRYLRRPRNGVTSASLKPGEGPLDLLQTVGATLLAHRSAPAASVQPAPEPQPTLDSGEGRFGGGGASGQY